MLDSSPNNSEIMLQKANMLFRLNRENIEKDYLSLLKGMGDGKWEPYLQLGWNYMFRGDWEKSVAVLSRALGDNKVSPLNW